MRVLVFTNVFPTPAEPHRGTFNLEMVQALASTHDVAVIAPVLWTNELQARRAGRRIPASRYAEIAGIRTWCPRYYYTPKIFRERYGDFRWWSVRGLGTRVLREFKPDVLLGYWVHPDGQSAANLAHIAGVPVVLMSGGSDVLLLTADAGRKRAVQDVLSRADAVVTIGKHLSDALVDLGVPTDKITVSYRSVDLDRFNPGDGDRGAARHRLKIDAPADMRMLLWVGHMVPVKGLDMLLDAAARLHVTRRDWRLYLVGDGPLRAGVIERARAAGLAEHVVFPGAVPHAQLADWFRAADISVMSSVSEGIPNVLLESIACGTRFVAPRVGGIPEIAQDGLDRLVTPADAAALAEGLDASLSLSPSLSSPNMTAAPRAFRPWSRQQVADCLTGVLTSVVARSAASAGSTRAKPSPSVSFAE
jgi:glycosyltransferase involved in cell wall biosynthesis